MKPIAAISGLLATFVAIGAAVLSGFGQQVDRKLILAFRTLESPPRFVGPEWLPETARNLTAIGSVTLLSIVITVAVGCFIITNNTVAARRVLVAIVGGLALLNLLKWGIARPRPDFVPPFGVVFTHSFPSGHAALSATTYFTLAAILTQMTSDRRLSSFIVSVSLALTFIAGLSRVYLGLHYPSDVVAGWCFGAAWALSCGLIMDRNLKENAAPGSRATGWTRDVG